jgi:hypothetical protein
MIKVSGLGEGSEANQEEISAGFCRKTFIARLFQLSIVRLFTGRLELEAEVKLFQKLSYKQFAGVWE